MDTVGLLNPGLQGSVHSCKQLWGEIKPGEAAGGVVVVIEDQLKRGVFDVLKADFELVAAWLVAIAALYRGARQ